jgi:hypothetical protein
MENGPAVSLHHTVDRGNDCEWILLGLARDYGAGMTTSIFPNNHVEN